MRTKRSASLPAGYVNQSDASLRCMDAGHAIAKWISKNEKKERKTLIQIQVGGEQDATQAYSRD
jgi:hypothetical protein